MKRIQNNPFCMVDEMIDGILMAHGDRFSTTENHRVIVRRDRGEEVRVGLVSGGGSGHEPAFCGFVGEGMLDAVAVGDVFSSPTPKDFFDAIVAADRGKGVLLICGHFRGDERNSDIAIDMARREGIQVEKVVACDNVNRPEKERDERQALTALLFMWKAAGSMSSRGCDLAEIRGMMEKINANSRSIAIAFSPCRIPFVEKSNYRIEDGNMEFGIGLHGNPGIKQMKIESASGIADDMLAAALAELDLKKEDHVSVIVNGLGSTPLMELFVLYREIYSRLQTRSLTVDCSFVGNYITSLDTSGVSVTVLKMDAEIGRYLSSEV